MVCMVHISVRTNVQMSMVRLTFRDIGTIGCKSGSEKMTESKSKPLEEFVRKFLDKLSEVSKCTAREVMLRVFSEGDLDGDVDIDVLTYFELFERMLDANLV